MAKQPPEPDFFLNAREPALGVGIFVRRSLVDGTQTYRFKSGDRSFKDAYCAIYMKPAVPSDEVRKLLTPSPVRPTAVAAKARHSQLEAEILAAPDEATPYLVYGDWLQQQQDPRGELVAVQHAGHKAREKKLFAEHGAYFMPVMLARVLREPKRAAHSTATWRNGFLDEVRLALPETERAQYIELDKVIDDLLAHPSAAFLRRLVLGQQPAQSYTYIAQLAAIARAKHAGLRELFVGDFAATDMALAQTRAGDFAAVIENTPNLRSLHVRAGELRSAKPFEHATLQELRVETVELASREVRRLCDGAFPELHTLELAADGLGFAKEQLVQLRAQPWPKLRHLTIRGALDAYHVVDAILPWVAQLETLVLERSDLDAAGARRILERHADFAHLGKLVLSGPSISAELQATIAATLANSQFTATRFALHESDVVHAAPDRASLTAARNVAHAAKWMELGYDPARERVWGEYEGGDHYRVYVEFQHGIYSEVGCECPSPKNPCKHALALMLLAARQHPFVDRAMPADVIRNAARERPSYHFDHE